MKERDASPVPAAATASADRLTAASSRGYGAIRAIANCGRAGLLSPADVRELNDAFHFRVYPLLESASILQRTADLVRGLVDALHRLSARPVAREPVPVPAESAMQR